MSVHYEWDVEAIDENDDIQEHFFCKSFAEAMSTRARLKAEGVEGERFDVALVRTSEDGRTWAYLEQRGEGRFVIGEHFFDAFENRRTKIPVKYLAEISRWKAAQEI